MELMPHACMVSFSPQLLFALGLIGVLVRRNVIFILMSIEVMLNAAGLAFVVAGARWGQPDGQVMFLFILAMAAAEVSVGLALVLRALSPVQVAGYRRHQQDERVEMLELLWLVPAIPFAGALVLAVFGARMSHRSVTAVGCWDRRRIGHHFPPHYRRVPELATGNRNVHADALDVDRRRLPSARRSPSIWTRSRW